MYRAADSQLSVYDFLPPYHGELAADNRWVRLAAIIDWESFEAEYSALFARGGKIAIPARVALGSLIVREVYGATDRQTVELIRESPYLQYFIGMPIPWLICLPAAATYLKPKYVNTATTMNTIR